MLYAADKGVSSTRGYLSHAMLKWCLHRLYIVNSGHYINQCIAGPYVVSGVCDVPKVTGVDDEWPGLHKHCPSMVDQVSSSSFLSALHLLMMLQVDSCAELVVRFAMALTV